MLIETQEQARQTRHVDGVSFRCSDCGEVKPVGTSCGTGYGYDKENRIICYACCGERDKKQMQETGRATLYLVESDGQHWVTNWPNTLKFSAGVSVGRHNIAGRRYDAWFHDHTGARWHGVTYGDNTQICHCKRLKHVD
jgi:hypothetical protein